MRSLGSRGRQVQQEDENCRFSASPQSGTPQMRGCPVGETDATDASSPTSKTRRRQTGPHVRQAIAQIARDPGIYHSTLGSGIRQDRINRGNAKARRADDRRTGQAA